MLPHFESSAPAFSSHHTAAVNAPGWQHVDEAMGPVLELVKAGDDVCVAVEAEHNQGYGKKSIFVQLEHCHAGPVVWPCHNGLQEARWEDEARQF